MNASEIVAALGGVNAASRLFEVKPPSVSGWIKSGLIPRGRLIERAALVEIASAGRFRRQQQWPDAWKKIWPELMAAAERQPELTVQELSTNAHVKPALSVGATGCRPRGVTK